MRKTLHPRKKTAKPLVSSKDGKSLLIKDAHIWTDAGISRGSILIEEGRIRKISRRIANSSHHIVRASKLLALPGLVDAHVHLRDLELAYKEDFATGTSAAAAGGFTTLLDMPNTQPPTITAQRLREKQSVAAKRIHVNVGFHVAAVSAQREILAMASAGAFSLKLYMPSPIAPLDIGDDTRLLDLMHASRVAGLPVTVHAEALEAAGNDGKSKNFLEMAKARSPELETKAVIRMLELAGKSGCSIHFCHLTLASSLTRARSKGEGLTTEVTPHHLLLSLKALPKLTWKGWMVPPLRDESTRRALLQFTARGMATAIASDHAPHTREEKNRLPDKSPPGVPGLETTLPLLLTLVHRRLMPLSLVVKLLSSNPARIFGLRSAGKLRVDAKGDVVLVDLKKGSKIDPSRFFSKAKFSPFEGYVTKGAVHSTIVNGTVVYNDGEIVSREGTGSVLKRGRVD